MRTQSQTGRDVTREHVTAKDRLRAARAERRSLLRRLEVATMDEEAEAIRRRLDLVAGEINGLRGQLRNLRLRTGLRGRDGESLPAEGRQQGGAGGGSFDDAIGDAGDILVAVPGVIVRVLAVALPLGLIALVGWLGARVPAAPPARVSALGWTPVPYPRGCGCGHRHALHRPGLPLGYSFRPAHARLRWRFGDQASGSWC